MKKTLVMFLSALLLCSGIFLSAQENEEKTYTTLNLSVLIDDEIYGILDYYQMKGFLSPMGGVRPYTVGRIFDAIDEIYENKDKLTDSEYEYLESFKARYELKNKTDKKNWLGHCALSNNSEVFPVNFLYDFGIDVSGSAGIYNNSDFNSYGFDSIIAFDFKGDVTKYLSYSMYNYFDFSRMPLYENTENYSKYFIGYYWFEDGTSDFLYGEYQKDENGEFKLVDGEKVPFPEPTRREIRTYKNNSYLPYGYHKPWAGQFYYLSDFTASGLEGWAMEPGISGGTTGEIRSSLFSNHVNIGMGRNRKEWAGMDNGSSLVLNANAQPFFEINQSIELFKWLHFSAMTGILEYPNQYYINEGAYDNKNSDDAAVFQNAFSINMLDLDWKYVHIDLGSTVVWPKRFELGYLFPLLFYVEYQNHIGDYDNMSLFGDIKLRYPGLGSVWASMYLDEMSVSSSFLTQTRVMYAAQAGLKAVVPFLPSATVSMRYTKVEPYCYTHHGINNTPWYEHYIGEAYTNNGESLGYYLDPNSDELFFRLDSKFTRGTKGFMQYQFIRHGADYGSQQVPGSSYYSELPTKNRDELKKYFLHDGAYNWIHILNFGYSYKSVTGHFGLPFELSANLGFMYSYYTMIDDADYDRSIYGNNGNCANADFKTEYKSVDTNEYPVQYGVVFGLGAKIVF